MRMATPWCVDFTLLVSNHGCCMAAVACAVSLRRRCKYTLRNLVRTAVMDDDAAYGAALEIEDADGNKGIKLSRELPRIAGGFDQ